MNSSVVGAEVREGSATGASVGSPDFIGGPVTGATDGSNSSDGANVCSTAVGSAVNFSVVGSEVREG